MLSAMRCAVDVKGSPRRLVIEHVETPEQHRRKGHARLLTEHALHLGAEMQADVYVVALEEAASYWLELGFVLEQDEAINEKYNLYSDTHLMKLPSNKTGSALHTHHAHTLLGKRQRETAPNDDQGNKLPGGGECAPTSAATKEARWVCVLCTFVNTATVLCSVCDAAQPQHTVPDSASPSWTSARLQDSREGSQDQPIEL
eukprot:TRINITY_DN3498_c0_g1_i2.p1 TRINITY_DN3498_c0_g1~~TRINITY_DN3498_c0_g1_i2.p1  ORF type:complete len:201 (-),score=46.97 TRINITY_DN3498_c0_g1_i2:332-934(-)